jgi:glycosyltransferase involved in cell wall biosynthesis
MRRASLPLVTPPQVSVVMPARNAESTVGGALAALSTQVSAVPWEIVVVDNGSSDSTSRVVASWSSRLPDLRIVACDRRGANAARNTGIRASRGELILCCDADDEAAPRWLEAMVDALQSFDLVGGCLDVDRLNPSFVAETRVNPVNGSLPVAGGLPYAVGASMGFHRLVFDRIGGFDEDFVFGGDEIDFCWRAQRAGFRIGLAPRAVTYYRFRTGMWAYYRQYRRYEVGAAQVCAKHVELGHLARPAVASQVKSVLRRSRAALRVDRFVRRDERWAYVYRVAVFVGSLEALARYRMIA